MLDAWFSTLGGRLGVSTDSEQEGAPPAALQIAMLDMPQGSQYTVVIGLKFTFNLLTASDLL